MRCWLTVTSLQKRNIRSQQRTEDDEHRRRGWFDPRQLRMSVSVLAPPSTGTSKLARNVIWNLCGQLVPMLAAFIAVPAVLKRIGTERFGVLMLAWLVA